MNETTLAYLAGFFDGEGTICICRRADRKSYALRIAVGQMQRAPLELFQSVFGGNIHQLRRGQRTDMLQWNLMRSALQRSFLTQLSPYLRAKKAEADLGLRFLDITARLGFGGFVGRAHPEILAERVDVFELCKAAKLRPPFAPRA